MEERFMKRAIELAKKGKGYVNPNPLVGAVIVKNGKIIGEGYHMIFGGAHAEINVINNSSEDVRGGSMYVTLEPCCHHGKTPPCVEAIIRNGLSKVYIGMKDPNNKVSGKGIKRLENAGIEVEVGILQEEIMEMNRIFIKYIGKKQPYIIMKTATTLDGKIATYSGDSKWISGEVAREYVHQIRHNVMGIMVGINTIIADNPRLTTRLKNGVGKDPVRIIVDTKGRIPLDAKVIHEKSKAKTILATTELIHEEKANALRELGVELMILPIAETGVDLKQLMIELGKLGIDSILLEGGASLNWSSLKAGIVDEVMTFIAPKIVGGESSKTAVAGTGVNQMNQAIILDDVEYIPMKRDLLIRGKVKV